MDAKNRPPGRTWAGAAARARGLTLLAASRARGVDPLVVGDHGFADFIQGEFGNSGANLYVSKAGHLGSINRWDFNGDGYVELVFSNFRTELWERFAYKDNV
jgi:hypothetical protein